MDINSMMAQADARAKAKAMEQIQRQQENLRRSQEAPLPEGVAMTEGATTREGKGIGLEDIRKAFGVLQDYKQSKSVYDKTIISNNKWWELRHWEEIRKTDNNKKEEEREPEPASAWLQNMISNKHADFMDNFPEPVILEREQGDRKDADKLSKILPVLHERNNFESVYSEASLYKIKNGCSVYGVFWDQSKDVIGDVAIQHIDFLNLFFEPRITDIQDSRNLFIVDNVDREVLLSLYPEFDEKGLDGSFIVEKYRENETRYNKDKFMVVDWYYKKQVLLENGTIRRVLHYCKFSGDNILFASENDPVYRERGWYDHGLYPIVLDPLFQMSGTPFGYGFLHIAKDPQLYIDKLYGGVLQAAIINSKPRYFYNKQSNLDMAAITDLSQQFIGLDGDLDERNLRPFIKTEIDQTVLAILDKKIAEMKATTSNEDFGRGATSGGVTAAAAIAALQEAGNKVSRDMISASYRAFRQVVYLEIELIRQFYDEARNFRIVGEDGVDYETLDNANLNGTEGKMPIFDIVVKAQRRNPFSVAGQNELAKELYGLGFFNPQLAEQTLGALELMEFEGKEKVILKALQGMTLMKALAEMQQLTMEYALGVQLASGRPVAQEAASRIAEIMAHFDVNPGRKYLYETDEQRLGYGEKLARRAIPKVEE